MAESNFNPSFRKKLAGTIACALVGAAGGVLGSVFSYILGTYVLAGLLGQNEPGFLSPVLSGGWILGFLGLLPGLIVGLIQGITNKNKFWLAVVILVVVSCYCSELLYGYPTTIPAIVFYITSPIFIVMGSVSFSRWLKIRLGLMPPEQVEEINKIEEELFNYKRFD